MLIDMLTDTQNLKLTLASLEESSVVLMLDRDGSLLYANQIFGEMIGLTKDQLLGRSLQSLLLEANVDELLAGLFDTLNKGKAWKGELGCRAEDHANKWIKVTIVPYFDEHGQMNQSVVFGTDITEQRLNEIRLNEMIANLVEIENALDASSIVAITDSAGVISYVNDKFCEISKYSREELLGRTHRIINSSYHSKTFFKEMWATIKSGGIWRGEVKNRAKDGTEYWMNTTIVPFLDDHKKPRQFIAIRSDITARVKAEEELAERTEQLARMRDEAVNANNVKSQFLANMSHELRTPLNAIIGYSEMLREEAEELGEAVFVEDLQKISRAGNHLLALINDILDISKIEAGKMELHIENCSLPDLMQDVIATMRPLIEDKGNQLIYEGLDHGQMVVDVLKMRQVFLNLLSNANKFTDQGKITMLVDAKQHGGRDGYSVTIQDTGIGMTDAQMDKLFQPFTQIDSSMTRKYGGTGLGLSISQRIMEMLGGHIEVNSEFGVGTSFVCWIPSIQMVLAEIADEDAPETDWSGDVNIVLIDDETSDHRLMERYLDRTNWNLAYADNGKEGLRLVKACKPDVICLDILMPEMDGWRVLELLKADPETAHIPVIIWSMATDQQRSCELGAAAFLAKPSERERMIEVLGKYIR